MYVMVDEIMLSKDNSLIMAQLSRIMVNCHAHCQTGFLKSVTQLIVRSMLSVGFVKCGFVTYIANGQNRKGEEQE